jgi:hypothetical protein
MYRLADVAGGVLAALGLVSLAVSAPSSFGRLSLGLSAPAAVAGSVDRSQKGDRLADPRPADERNLSRVATVEVVGVRDTAIIYRDRDGRVLFRTDPVANVTVIAKDVSLPQVTVREHGTATPPKLPVKTIEERESDQQMIGCDPVASPLAGSISRRTGRCIASTTTSGRLAALFN